MEATYQHAKNLAQFVFTYKALTTLMKELESKPKEYHSFVAAFIGGWLVFGKNNKINEQVIWLPFKILILIKTRNHIIEDLVKGDIPATGLNSLL